MSLDKVNLIKLKLILMIYLRFRVYSKNVIQQFKPSRKTIVKFKMIGVVSYLLAVTSYIQNLSHPFFLANK